MKNDKNEEKEKFVKRARIIGLIFIIPMTYALLTNLQNELYASICIIFIVLNIFMASKPEIVYKILS